MRKLFVALVASILMTGFSANANTINLSTADNVAVSTIVQEDDEASGESVSFTQELKTRFIEGGPGFMGIVLICLILGLAIAIERIIFLNLATTNTKKLISQFLNKIKNDESYKDDIDGSIYSNFKSYNEHKVKILIYNNSDKINKDLTIIFGSLSYIE